MTTNGFIGWVVIVAWSIAAYSLGAASVKTDAPTCPRVEGGRVLQTMDSSEGQMCIYIADKTISQKKLKVRLKT